MIDPTTVNRPMPIEYGGEMWKRLCEDPNWVAQYKYNGYRCLVRRTNNGVELWSRHGNRISADGMGLPRLFEVLFELPEGTEVDGEIVRGVGYCPFDLLTDSWEDLRGCSLEYRLERLRSVIPATPEPDDSAERAYTYALACGHEGIVLKNLEANYFGSWFKVKP